MLLKSLVPSLVSLVLALDALVLALVALVLTLGSCIGCTGSCTGFFGSCIGFIGSSRGPVLCVLCPWPCPGTKADMDPWLHGQRDMGRGHGTQDRGHPHLRHLDLTFPFLWHGPWLHGVTSLPMHQGPGTHPKAYMHICTYGMHMHMHKHRARPHTRTLPHYHASAHTHTHIRATTGLLLAGHFHLRTATSSRIHANRASGSRDRPLNICQIKQPPQRYGTTKTGEYEDRARNAFNTCSPHMRCNH